MSGSRPRVLATAIAVALSVLLAAPAGARKPKKPRKPRPDLIVTGVNWDGSSYLIQNELNTITFDDQTMNAARKGSRTAGPSTTALRLYQSYGGPFVPTKVSRPVPALKPRSSSVAKTTKTGRIGPGFLGTYVPFACADTPDRVAERKEGNNCTSAYDVVTILARKWMGTVTGAWSTNGIQEKWTADVTFTFDRETHPNVYAYSIELANISYTTSGTDPEGCTYSGGGGYTISNPIGGQGLFLHGDLDQYGGDGVLNGGAPRYPITQTCPHNDPLQLPGPFQPDWFLTGGEANPIAPTHGYTSLAGSWTSGPTTWHWDLHAQ